ncbi:hypothetical protein [Streptomyces sp. OV198]|uniref:hypothetical protein n=1 Tax=Streptomyces sp. OV198 TaxID=1882787 RepID=UPI00359CA0C0
MLITGDALVTTDPTSRRIGPQLLPGMFHADHTRTLDALPLIEDLESDVLAPGHGPVYQQFPRESRRLGLGERGEIAPSTTSFRPRYTPPGPGHDVRPHGSTSLLTGHMIGLLSSRGLHVSCAGLGTMRRVIDERE